MEISLYILKIKKLTKLATSEASYTMTQGKGQVWAQVAREPRTVLLSSRSLSLTLAAMVLVWLCHSLLLTTAILASSPPTKIPVVTCCPPGSFLAIEDSLKLRQLPNGTWGRLWTISTIGMREVLVNCLKTIPPCWLIRAFIELTISDTTTSPQFIASLTWTAFLPSMGLPVRRTLTQYSTAPSRLQTIRYWRAQARIIEFIN